MTKQTHPCSFILILRKSRRRKFSLRRRRPPCYAFVVDTTILETIIPTLKKQIDADYLSALASNTRYQFLPAATEHWNGENGLPGIDYGIFITREALADIDKECVNWPQKRRTELTIAGCPAIICRTFTEADPVRAQLWIDLGEFRMVLH
jgi:hypothetical protein